MSFRCVNYLNICYIIFRHLHFPEKAQLIIIHSFTSNCLETQKNVSNANAVHKNELCSTDKGMTVYPWLTLLLRIFC